MILHFLCTLLFLTTIGCYSVNEEEVEADEPSLDSAAATKHEKSLKLNSLKDGHNGHNTGDDEASPYNDETPIKAVKYKNYGYFNPSVATLKTSRQAAVPKHAALSAAHPAAFQFKTDRNLVSLMSQNGSVGKPVFHFQRRLDENQFELEEIGDNVNVRDRQERPNAYIPDHRSYKPNYHSTFNGTRVLNLRPSPHHASSRRYYQRAFTSDETAKPHSAEKSSRTSKLAGENSHGNDVDFESLSSSHSADVDRTFGDKKDRVNKGGQPSDSEREALNGSQREYFDISSESEESDRAAADVDLDREYRKLPFTARGRFSPRRKVERSLADPEPVETEGGPSSFFIPTPIPGFLYPKSEEVVDNTTSKETKKGDASQAGNLGSSATESVSHSTYFLPTRPAGASSEEVQSITDGLSSFYTAGNTTDNPSSRRPPIVFVTAPVDSGPSGPDNFATVEEEISEKKNFSIEDFYNAFSANVTQYPNRHRDPDEGSSVTTSVNSAPANSFLAFAPHFPLSPVSDLVSSRAIKYPCTCDKGKCGCCTGRIMSNFNINIPARGCLNITYIPEDFEFMVKMTYNDRTLAQRRVSGKNPRPMCVPLPRLSGRAQACVKLSNVYLVGRNVHMCLDLEAKVQSEELFKVSFDCVRMGTSGIKWIKPEDGGGLGPPPVVEGPAPDDYDAVVASEGDEITDAKENKKKANEKRPGSIKGTVNTNQNSLENPVKGAKDDKRKSPNRKDNDTGKDATKKDEDLKAPVRSPLSQMQNVSESGEGSKDPVKGVNKDGVKLDKHVSKARGSSKKKIDNNNDEDDDYDGDY